MGQNGAVNIGGKLIIDKINSEIKDVVIKQTMASSIRPDATQLAADKAFGSFKMTLGIGMMFVNFVDSYSKAVAASKLEQTRLLYCCPHIGQLNGRIASQTLADKTTATVWESVDGYWYFHPQINRGLLRDARLSLRSTESGFKTVYPGQKSDYELWDCLGCAQAHGGDDWLDVAMSWSERHP